MAVKTIPDGYHSVTPYLVVNNAQGVLDFLEKVFGAQIHINMGLPDGKIGHSEATIAGSKVMVCDSNEKWPAMPTNLYVYVEDADATYKKALEAGGESVMEPADQFYGDRHGGVKDVAGNTWWIATHIEDVSEEELKRRTESFRTQMQS